MLDEIWAWFAADARRIVAVPIVGWFFLRRYIYNDKIKIAGTEIDTHVR